MSCLQGLRNIAAVECCSAAVHGIVPDILAVMQTHADVAPIVAAGMVCVLNDATQTGHLDSLPTHLPLAVQLLENHAGDGDVSEAGIGTLGTSVTSVVAWVCGRVGVWVHGVVGAGLCGRMGLWAQGGVILLWWFGWGASRWCLPLREGACTRAYMGPFLIGISSSVREVAFTSM
jgi:hypothetical protein